MCFYNIQALSTEMIPLKIIGNFRENDVKTYCTCIKKLPCFQIGKPFKSDDISACLS